MKALVLESNQNLLIKEIAAPTPAADEVLIRVRAAGVCSSDVARAFDGGAYRYPLVMGHELCGEITAVGAKAKLWKKGQRVTVYPLIPCRKCEFCKQKKFMLCLSYDYYGSRRDGGFCEFLNVKGWNLVLLPKSVPFEEGALVEPVAVVLHALKKVPLKGSIKVLILGAGFLGQIAVKLLRKKNPSAEITVVDRNEFKLNLITEKRVTPKLLQSSSDWESFTKASLGYDVVLEATGSPDIFLRSIDLTKRSGHLIWMGNPSGDMNISKKSLSQILRKEISIHGTWNSDLKDWKDVVAMMQKGFRVSSDSILRVPLSQASQALQKLHQQKNGTQKHGLLKVVVLPSN